MKIICCSFFLSILFSFQCIAQEIKSPTVKFLTRRGYGFQDKTTNKKTIADSLSKWPETLYYNTIYKSKLLGSPTIPISFSRIEYVNGAYQVSPTISIGYGYAWFLGDFTFREDDKISVDPTFFFGLIGDIGLQNDFDLTNPAAIFAGGFFGFKAYSLFLGYDFVTRSPSIGLGGRIDMYTISQNHLNPYGKVRELRKHKRSAIPIGNE